MPRLKEGEHMTSTGPAARGRWAMRVSLRRLAVCALACGVSAESSTVALATTAVGTTAAGPAADGTATSGAGATSLGMARAAAGRWTPSEAPLPNTAAESPSPGVRQLTCAAVGSCVGVASFTETSRNRSGVIEQLSNGNWTATPAPEPAGTPANAQVVLSSVSCPTIRSCGISGYLDTPDSRQPELLTLRNGTWTAQAAPLVPGTEPESSTSLSSISCPRPGRCVAVGRYQDAEGNFQGLIETQYGTAWRARTAPLPADAGPDPVGGLEWVTCPAAGQCTAVGAYVDNQGSRQLSLDVTSGRRWTSSTAPLPADAAIDPVAYLGYVTCRKVGNCLAVGNYVTSLGAAEGLLERQVAGRWRAITAPVPADADPENPRATIKEASCPTVRFCAATGAYRDTNNSSRASLLTLSNGTWRAVTAPPPPGDESGKYLSAVSCPSAYWCVADGSTNASGIFETYARDHWTVTLAPLPASGFHGVFLSTSVSCPAVGACAAFGSYTKHNGIRPQGQGLLETFSAR
jgi:hypothetical protein